jgi:hypothetical protein
MRAKHAACLAVVGLLALTATAFATGSLGSGSAPAPPPDGVTAQYEPNGDLKITVTMPEPTNVFVIAGRNVPGQKFNGGCGGLQADINPQRGDAEVYLASDPNANNQLKFPIEQDGRSTTVVVPQQKDEAPLQPECMLVILDPYSEELDMQPLPPVTFDQSGKAVVNP